MLRRLVCMLAVTWGVGSVTCLAAAPPDPVDPVVQVGRGNAGDAGSSDQFSTAVAIDGNTMVVGAPFHDHPAADQGAVYVLTRYNATAFLEVQEISVGSAGDTFGLSVAIDGDTLVVGAPNHDVTVGGNEGAAYVYVKSGTLWVQQQKLTAVGGGVSDAFGHSVAISGDMVVVGAPFHDGPGIADQGAAFVFVRSGTTWTQQAELTLPVSDAEAFDIFGASVAISGTTVVAGAPFDTVDGSFLRGSAFVFVLSGSWTLQQRLSVGAAVDGFGWSVALRGETAVVGAPNVDVTPNGNEGAAHMFTRTAGTWGLVRTLTATAPAPGDAFGHSVALGSDLVAVGAPLRDPVIASSSRTDAGTVFVFDRGTGTPLVLQSADPSLPPFDASTGDHCGWSVATSGNTIVTGMPLHDWFSNDLGRYSFVTLVPVVTGVSPDGGAAYSSTAVTIAGHYFLPGATVRFGAYWFAPATVVSATTIAATTPVGPFGPTDIEIRNPDQTTGTLPAAYTYRYPPSVERVSPNVGLVTGGTKVTITGTDFLPGASVTLGGVPAVNVVGKSATTLEATTGAHAAGPVDVVVTNPDGQSGSLSSAFLYRDPPPTITTVTPAATRIYKDAFVTISGTGFTPGAQVTFGLYSALSITVVNSTTITATVVGMATPMWVDVAVTNQDYQSGVLIAGFEFMDPPSVTVTSPNSQGGAVVNAGFVTLSGTVEDDRGVMSVTWSRDQTVSGSATLTPVAGASTKKRYTWVAQDIPLNLTDNDIRITAVDSDGNAGSTDFIASVFALTEYLAEGATGTFFDLDVAIVNADPNPTDAWITFLTADQAPITYTTSLPGWSRGTVRVNDVSQLATTAVSTLITANYVSHTLLVERTMFWDRASWYGGHGEKAIESIGTRWYFAEGSQGFFDTWVLLVNANTTAAHVSVTFLTEASGTVTKLFDVPGNSRYNVFTGVYPELVNQSFSIVVDSDLPIVAERAMYFGNTGRLWEGGHESVGVPELSTSWFHAEGATGPFFETYILVGNPNGTPANVTMTFLLASGTTITRQYVVKPKSRLTVNVEWEHPALADVAVSTTVSSDVPVVSERAMYWPGGAESWTEAHNSFGMTVTGTKWGFAEGRVGLACDFDTFILLANPNDTAATVTVTFIRELGQSPVVKTYTVDATSRFNVWVNALVPELSNETFGAIIESTNGVPIVAERAMYWDSGGVMWAGGTNATAIRMK
jgi:hypothetical protein